VFSQANKLDLAVSVSLRVIGHLFAFTREQTKIWPTVGCQ